MRFKDLTGIVVGRLTVLGIAHRNVQGVFYWTCECECGNKTTVARNSLQQKVTRSCGCLARESAKARATTHGMTGTKTYKVWCSLIERATDPNHKNARYYFDKGITVCDEWLKFENFLADMGEQPPGLWIERIENSLPYSKDNCKWETPSRQCSNRGRCTNTSGRLGVSWDKASNKWRAAFKVDKKRVELGRFKKIEDAIAAVEEAELTLLGYSRRDFVAHD